jgi:hypothetical protein
MKVLYFKYKANYCIMTVHFDSLCQPRIKMHSHDYQNSSIFLLYLQDLKEFSFNVYTLKFHNSSVEVAFRSHMIHQNAQQVNNVKWFLILLLCLSASVLTMQLAEDHLNDVDDDKIHFYYHSGNTISILWGEIIFLIGTYITCLEA